MTRDRFKQSRKIPCEIDILNRSELNKPIISEYLLKMWIEIFLIPVGLLVSSLIRDMNSLGVLGIA